MPTDLTCHLVDLSSVPSIAMSLPLRYLQASAEADARLSGRCDFSQQCTYLSGSEEAAWRTIAHTLDERAGTRRVVAFTSLCWNSQLNLRLAARIKGTFPEALVVFGGNDVTNQAPWVLQDGSGVDVLVNGEGEAVFPNVLASYLETGDAMDFHGVRGVSFRSDDGRIVTTDAQPVIHQLDDIPSPFYGEAGEEIARSTALICEFSRGCPFECSFCNWGGAIGTQVRRFSIDRLRRDLDFLISHMQTGALMYIADSNFGMTDADLEAAHLLVDTVRKYDKRVYVFTNFAKNTNRRVVETATLLYRSGLISMVTLSAQTLNPDALVIARRQNMPFDNYRRLQEEFRQLGIPTYTELLIGMPGESYESFLAGIERVFDSGGRPVIYTLLLLNNTHYATPEIRQRYGLRSRLMPFHSLDMSIRAETSVGHDRLSYDEFLLCVGLMITVPIYGLGFMRFVMERLRAVYGVGYGQMLDCLTRHCAGGAIRSHPLVRRLFVNFIAMWKDPADFDGDLLHAITGPVSGQFGPPHFQAIMKSLVSDVPAACALIEELAGLLADLSPRPLDRAQFATWVAYQQVIAEGMSQIARGEPGVVATDCELEALRSCAGPSVRIDDDDGTRTLHVRATFKRYSFQDFLFQITYGTCNTLALFENVSGAASQSPVRTSPATVRAVS